MMTSTNDPEPFIEDDNVYESPAASALVMEGTSVVGEDGQPAEGAKQLTDEEKAEQARLWKEELEKTEEEIQTLRNVLSSKLSRSVELKKNLGISSVGEIKMDIRHGFQAIKEIDAIQKTTAAVKAAKDMTSSSISNAGSKLTAKLGNLRNTSAFKSIEERVGNAYTSVKSKITSGKNPDDVDSKLSAEPLFSQHDDEEEPPAPPRQSYYRTSQYRLSTRDNIMPPRESIVRADFLTAKDFSEEDMQAKKSSDDGAQVISANGDDH